MTKWFEQSDTRCYHLAIAKTISKPQRRLSIIINKIKLHNHTILTYFYKHYICILLCTTYIRI